MLSLSLANMEHTARIKDIQDRMSRFACDIPAKNNGEGIYSGHIQGPPLIC